MALVIRICLLVSWAMAARAAMPPIEKCLPAETVAFVSTLDYARMLPAFDSSAQGRLWGDPSMKPFREHFWAGWRQQIVRPLEQAFSIPVEDISACCRGALTLAAVRSTETNRLGSLDFLAIADATDKAGKLKKYIEDSRRKWFQGGRDVLVSKLGDTEITLFSLSPTNDTERSSGVFASRTLAVAQVDTLFLAGTSKAAVERTIQALKGNTQSILAALPEFQHSRYDSFRPMPINAWLDGKALLNIAGRAKVVPPPSGSDTEAPVDVNRLLAAIGLEDLEAISFGVVFQATGTVLESFIANPEGKRRGLLKILAGQPGDATPLSFVPAEVTGFQRWRLDGKKAWQSLETMIGEISPQWLSATRLIMDTANQAGKLKEPLFDLSTNLVANLGNDLIRFTQNSGSGSRASLYLVNSPNPAQLANALRYIVVFLSETGEEPAEEEYLGNRIFSVPLASALRATSGTNAVLLHYAAASNYVALSTDSHLLKSYLTKAFTNSLSANKEVADAFRRIADQNTTFLGYLDQREAMRALFGSQDVPGATTAPILPSLPGIRTPQLADWCDWALLPPFEKVQSFFGTVVYGESVAPDGIAFRLLVSPSSTKPGGP